MLSIAVANSSSTPSLSNTLLNDGDKTLHLYVTAQTDNDIFERLANAYQWKPDGLHPCLTTAMGNTMSKPARSDHTTTDRLSESAHESVDQIAGSAGRAEERIRQKAGEARARASDAGHKAKERSEETLHTISSFVGEHPFMSLGIAFGAGALVSALRRRS